MTERIAPNGATYLHTIPILDCLKCGNALRKKEIDAQECWCEPCKKLAEAQLHRLELGHLINLANRRSGMV